MFNNTVEYLTKENQMHKGGSEKFKGGHNIGLYITCHLELEGILIRK